VTIVARGREALEATAAELEKVSPRGTAILWVAADITAPEGRAAALAACPQPDILVNNAGGPPPGDFRELDARGLDQGARRQHADAHRADQGDCGRHDRAPLRPHREHHLRRGEGAHRRAWPVQRRAQRTDRLRRRVSRGRPPGTTSPSTTCCPASSTPTASARWSAARPRRAAYPTTRPSPSASPPSPPAASAIPRSSAPPAPGCARPRPASSPGRTGCSTAGPIRELSRRPVFRATDATAPIRDTLPLRLPTMEARAAAA
jgi:hypothetical protein